MFDEEEKSSQQITYRRNVSKQQERPRAPSSLLASTKKTLKMSFKK